MEPAGFFSHVKSGSKTLLPTSRADPDTNPGHWSLGREKQREAMRDSQIETERGKEIRDRKLWLFLVCVRFMGCLDNDIYIEREREKDKA